MRVELLMLALAALALRPAWAEEAEPAEDAPVAPANASAFKPYTSSRGAFACDMPVSGWAAFEEETPFGSSAHFFGPVEESGNWRAAVHVHFLDKGQPGFVPLDDAVKRERRSDASADRESTPVRRKRVARTSARCFEVTETRLLPVDRLPAAPAVLHHYMAFVPAGDGYFIIKLTTSRDSYLEYRAQFERVLQTFRVLGY